MTPSDRGKKIFTLAEAADICGVTRMTMWRWVKSGSVSSSKTTGGHYRIARSDLILFMKNNRMAHRIDETVGPFRILIVDDEPLVQEYFTHLLSLQGYEVQVCSDGFEAGILVMRFRPHLILLDLYMPEVDGFQACRLVKSDFDMCKIKILAISGKATEENVRRILGHGADAFLEKPMHKDQLLETVSRLLGMDKALTIPCAW